MNERSVLQVLPHPGGGGETYLEALAAMEGYRFRRAYLVSRSRRAPSLLRGAVGVHRAALRHDALHAHGEVASGACLPALATRPSVVTLHGLHLLRRVSGLPRQLAEANLRLIVRAAARTICVSEAEHAELVDAVGARAARRALVIHNGVGISAAPGAEERAAARAELRIAPETVAGVCVGSLDEHKDPLTPVRAAIEVARGGADLVVLVVGDGPLRPEVERAARDKDAVRLLGFRADVRRVLAAADFFVLSSSREGLSFSLLEAMALGLPAVVSDAPGNPEAVGEAGLVVPYGDVAGFATAFRRLAADEGERLDLGARARERVAGRFRADEMVRRTREVYDEVVRERRGQAA